MFYIFIKRLPKWIFLGVDKVRGIHFSFNTEKWEIGGRQRTLSLSFLDLHLSFEHRASLTNELGLEKRIALITDEPVGKAPFV